MSNVFPKTTLEQAVAMPAALQRNGGNPLSAIDLATALGKSPGSSTIRTLGSASSAYGLTGGSYRTTFTMQPLGEAITSPTRSGERAEALVKAFMKIDVFQKVYEFYKGKKVPERQFLENTLAREFGVPAASTEKFADIFLENLRYVGLIKPTPGGDWISAEAVSALPQDGAQELVEEDTASQDDFQDEHDELVDTPQPPGATHEERRSKRPNMLFVGHGRNKKPLEQLTSVLRDLGIPHLVAENEANAGRPISAKVRETMQQCGAAILIFSADVEYFDKDQNSVWRPSENVSHELGAAAVMYDDRIILFKEESVSLASNYSGIGYIPFEKDRLDAETNALLRELVALKILRLSVGGDD